MLKNMSQVWGKTLKKIPEGKLHTWSQVPAAPREESIPQNSKESLPLKIPTVKIPDCIVWLTWEPTMNAPENSNTAAVSTACRSDRAPDPTEVPIAFATSFAPMFQAM